MNNNLGYKIKQLRCKQNMTLDDLSEKTKISLEFLSQLERGLTSITSDRLKKIADVFKVDVSYFFIKEKDIKTPVIRSYEEEFYDIYTLGYVQYNLSNNLDQSKIYPRIIEILPSNKEEKILSEAHNGEEFIYVLEGLPTVFLNEKECKLYPGDSIHYNSLDSHIWANYTNKMVKLLVVSTPNPFNNNQ